MKLLRVCADDYGMSAPVSRAIVALAAQRRITETSCLVGADGWRDAARALADAPVRAGLHFALTEGRPLSPDLAAVWPELPPLPRLIAQAHLRRLPVAALRSELTAQLDRFEQLRGAAPAHLDGHQHVHHLPQVRDLVLEVLAARPGLVVRHSGRVAGPGFAWKRALIAGTGGRRLGRRLEALGKAQNAALVGVYDFGAADYRRLMRRWLAALPARGALLFCHPGEAGAGDAIAPARRREFGYLASNAFAEDLQEAGVALDGSPPAPTIEPFSAAHRATTA